MRWCCSLLLLLFVCQPLLALSVVDVKPAPNYKLTDKREAAYKKNLVDRQDIPFPTWLDERTVTWQGRSAITIALDLGALYQPQSYKVEVHTAQGQYADVNIPRHVDIYSSSTQSKYKWAGSISANGKNLADRAKHVIATDINNMGRYVIMVIHADGRYISIDDIRITPSLNNSSPVLSKERLCKDISSCTEESREWMKKALTTSIDEIPTEFEIYPTNPWDRDLPKTVNQEPDSLAGMEDEQLVRAYRVSTPESARWRFYGTGDLSAIQAFLMEPVLAIDGGLYKDALVPVDSLPPGIHDIWLSFDIRKLNHGDNLHWAINSGGHERVFNYTVKKPSYQLTKTASLKAVNWAYLNNQVLPAKNIDDLTQHGINIFVLPWQVVPGLPLNEAWSVANENTAADYLKTIKNKGLVLIHLGWEGHRRPDIVGPTQAQMPDFEQWLKHFTAFMQRQGFSYEDWALYPIDEIRKEKLGIFLEIAEKIKAIDGAIQIYANPTTSGRYIQADYYLNKLLQVVDIWQPSFPLLTKKANFFQALPKEKFWFYRNPSYPAKAADPMRDYRLLAWYAYEMQATGIGFWSYNDIQGDSAWDDFDGLRADWSVIYEIDNNHFLSSRRWEAFAKGIADYRYLQLAKSINLETPSTQNITYQQIEGFRRAVIDALISGGEVEISSH